jgi:hypothetical protein
MVEAVLKSPSIPLFFKGGIFFRSSLNPSLEKRGRGDFGRSEGRIMSRLFELATTGDYCLANKAMR